MKLLRWQLKKKKKKKKFGRRIYTSPAHTRIYVGDTYIRRPQSMS